MPNPRHEASARSAVELMTAWLASPDGPPTLLLETLERHIKEHPNGDLVNGAVELIIGLTKLCGSLLVLRELETEVSGQRTLQDLRLEIARASGTRETSYD